MRKKPKTAWSKRRGESAQAYDAAHTYFELGPWRSIVAAAKRLGKSPSLLEKWSSKYNWVERADAFDQSEQQKRLEAFKRRILRAVQAGRQISHQDIYGEESRG